MHTASYLEEIGRQSLAAGSGPQSVVRLPDLSAKRPARGAILEANAAPPAMIPQVSLATEKDNTNKPIPEVISAAPPSSAESILDDDPFHRICARLLEYHAVLMRPKIWLGCVAGLTLVILVTWVCHTPAGSNSTATTQSADNASQSNLAQHAADPPARIVVPLPPAETEPEPAHSTALDSHGSSPGLQPASVVRVAERGDAARYDGTAGPEAGQPDSMGATLQEIEPISESSFATPQGASQP
ncbi:MAG TPA: hypothetical protein VND64_05970 [Pirellulales bacterium]|nr:hypothetical protein [Pirellulales bacterium]